jgi:type IV pilus assembly protein PilA
MIRKLQQLKAKKGFTLVELMVVIAIIGVLAAILIPLMANFITNARISSHNSTASTYRSQITYFFSDQQSRDSGYSSSTPVLLEISMNGRGEHDVDGMGTAGADGWGENLPTMVDGTIASTWKEAIEDYLDDNNPDTPDTAIAFIVIASNSAHAAMYIAGGTSVQGSAALTTSATDVFDFDGFTAGRTTDDNRYIIGSAPQYIATATP